MSTPYARPLSSYEEDVGARHSTYKKAVVEIELGEDGQIGTVLLVDKIPSAQANDLLGCFPIHLELTGNKGRTLVKSAN
jgi:hypothetical protein